MNTPMRIAIAAALLVLLAACGNKGPLVKPSQVPPAEPVSMPASPGDMPVDPAPAEDTTPAPAAEPAATEPAPEAAPDAASDAAPDAVPAADDSGG
jgi:predicted small lipoprotein YifL